MFLHYFLHIKSLRLPILKSINTSAGFFPLGGVVYAHKQRKKLTFQRYQHVNSSNKILHASRNHNLVFAKAFHHLDVSISVQVFLCIPRCTAIPWMNPREYLSVSRLRREFLGEDVPIRHWRYLGTRWCKAVISTLELIQSVVVSCLFWLPN